MLHNLAIVSEGQAVRIASRDVYDPQAGQIVYKTRCQRSGVRTSGAETCTASPSQHLDKSNPSFTPIQSISINTDTNIIGVFDCTDNHGRYLGQPRP